ncbi:low molecular weight phosphotyrosine protein phosphatase [Aquimarina sp. ERC-38]|uniref:low molecular weight protein-tyrosine-phosphatase n=1 Tax=Aquimarina sp. ERC-38 TaxID=2949996 RepID=UPI002247C42C|nr:low molecular weight protein-tyrosine-phosphatase [Aquimarina sp. ERC-38]UZO79353.1 low molecular weight phosphotyrosine protein phosphatase [Aquimarina sp. ERC-38]
MKTKILMVCLGNICRSPLAEGILRSKLDPDNFKVASCGTGNYHVGKAPDSRSIKVAKANHIDISNQKADQFKIEYFEIYDMIYTMDEDNYHNVLALASTQEDRDKVHSLLDVLADPTLKEVPDPYYGGEQGFTYVFKIINQACDMIAEDIQKPE